MHVEFIRTGERSYHALMRRADGVTVRVPGAGRMLPLPHDIVHFVAERELGLRGGFWGSVADGVLFGGMTIVSGRQRPHAADRSKALMRSNTDLMLQAEVVVGALDAIVLDGADADPRRALKRLSEAQSAVRIGAVPLDVSGLQRVCVALREAAARWRDLPVGTALTVEWNVRGNGSVRRQTRDRRRGRQVSRVPAGAA